MKSKRLRLLYDVLLILLFCFIWLHLNRNYLPELGQMGREGILYITAAGSGYGSIMSHGSLYAIFYLLMISQWMPDNMIQWLVRTKRKNYLFLLFKRMALCALQFSLIYVAVMVTFTVSFVDMQIILDAGFIPGAAVWFLFIFAYYLFIGSIYCFFNLIMMSDSKSYIVTFAISVFLLYLSRFKQIWTPVSTLGILEMQYDNCLSLNYVFVNLPIIIFLTAVFFFVSNIIFKDKDILHEKN